MKGIRFSNVQISPNILIRRLNLTSATNSKIMSVFRYILYVSAVDQAANVEDRRTSMAIVEVRIEGSLEDRPKPNPESQVVTSSSDELSNETEEFLKEAKRRVRMDTLEQGCTTYISWRAKKKLPIPKGQNS